MMKKKRRTIGILTALLMLAGGVASAATFQVTKLTDDNGPCDTDCSIREAILAANALPGRDLILVPAGTHVLTIPGFEMGTVGLMGDLDVSETVEIRGAGAASTIIESQMGEGVIFFGFPGSAPAEALLTDVTITGGTAGLGGGVYVTGEELTLLRVEVSGNSASIGGGGIYSGVGKVHLIDSTVSGNSGRFGGGVELVCIQPIACTARVERSTISGNTADISGGAIRNSGVALTIIDSTITDNHAPQFTGIRNSTGVERNHFERSIIDGNCNSSFFITSGGGNLESPGDTCQLADPSDLVNLEEVGLGPLADNGGPTRTHMPRPGSPAIDAAGLGCDAFDQRSFPRPEDGDFDGVALCDSGAVEAFSRGIAVDVPALGFPGGALLIALLALAGFGVLRKLG